MIDFIVILIIASMLALAINYMIKEKKKGVQCIGCPYARNCSKKKCSSRQA